MTRASGDGSLIAVVGIGCRLPGAPDPEAFWRLLSEGRDAVGEVPSERLELAGYAADGSSLWEEDPAARFGAFLEAVDGFDPAFFEISPREAAAMDPQQRLALELGWEALEDAGIAAGEVRGQAVGVFLGSIAGDYAALLDRCRPSAIDHHSVTGLNRGIIANRVSHALGFTGPSLTVDAAQSSSLVAVHLACESLRKGESEVALAGGIHLNLDPRGALKASRFGGLSPDGRCFTFDARANGYVRGEGGGIVVLKPLAGARADGDSVYCVIRGGAVNNDGAGEGLTVPSREAQEAVLSRAYRRAAQKRTEVQYVELHGSGTPLGDPIEAAALGAVLGDGREEPLPVGSAKTNVGHLEGAAGIAGLIKAALAIEHRRIPASLNFEAPSPRIPLDALGLRVQSELGRWPHEDRPLLAGVSSFGMGGTNCHLVLSEPPLESGKISNKQDNSDTGDSPLPGTIPLLLSAKSSAALGEQASRLAAHLGANPDLDLAAVGGALAGGRALLDRRAVAIGKSREELFEGLAALAAMEDAPGLAVRRARAARKAAFLFAGQGPQHAGMAAELLDASPPFAASIEECEQALSPFVDWSLSEVLRDEGGAWLDRLDMVQPALFATMVSLAKLWRRFGVRPSVVVGHSQGEIAAAHIAGGLSLDDAARVVALRGKAMAGLAGRGAMLSVSLPVEDLRKRIERFEGRISVAAINGPASLIVSGEPEDIAELLGSCEEDGVRAQRIAVDYAAHSAQIEALRDELLDAFAPISPRSGSVPFHSTVTGEPIDTARLDGEYWYRNLRQTVLLEPVVRSLAQAGDYAFVEVGAHPVLGFGVQETLDAVCPEEDVPVLGTLRRGDGGPERFALSLGEAHVGGIDVAWDAFFEGVGDRAPRLPTYPFQRKSYWFGAAEEARPGEDAAEGIPSREPEPAPEPEREADTLELVRRAAAVVLGHRSAEEVDPSLTFKELGFDSIAAVELRNRLRNSTGVRLPAPVVFNHPTPAALARFLHRRALGASAGSGGEKVAVRAEEEPIAIVGMACRYAGGADDPEALWGLVAGEREGIRGVPTDRGWDLDRLDRSGDEGAGLGSGLRGGFLDAPGEFDAAFFGIGPREALATDPQQRQLLEVCWESFEDAGLNPLALKATPTGVFVGISSQDYTAGLRADQPELDGYRITGSLPSLASGRVAYSLGLEGPAITVDTACSSSLVAVHLATQALRQGECSLAVAGGATVFGSLGMFSEFARQGGLSPDGRCKAFAEAADGAGFSEGAGVLVLERLSEAERNGRRVFATIRGSAVNQDGASNGLTAPNGPSQERVIRLALADARLRPNQVDAVEAHGTGTTLGDPIEAGALLATYGQDRDEPLRIGSVKSNIGHPQAAAGVAGVIKMVQAMRAGVLPKTLHVDRPSTKVEWGEGAVELLTEPREWKTDGRPRRAGVSSFGISGTNAHLILEEAPDSRQAGDGRAGTSPGASSKDTGARGAARTATTLLPLSAKSEPALREAARRLVARLEADPGLDLADVSWSLAMTRAHFEHRAVALGGGREELQGALSALAEGTSSPHAVLGRARRGQLAYLFTGQGAQRPGMGRELYESFPVYAEALLGACELFDRELDRGLLELVFSAPGSAEADLLGHTAYAQPALFATELALYRLLESWGLEPGLLAGHSIGELVAAHVAGVFSLTDAVGLVAARGRLMGALPEGGAMVAIEASEEELREAIAGGEAELSIAAVNGPAAVVLSGAERPLADVEARLREQGRKTKRLDVSHAFHSPLMEPMLGRFAEVAAGLDLAAPRIPIVSNLSGEPLGAEEATDPDYWVRHARGTVRFADAIATLEDNGASVYLELGPDAVLSAMATACLDREEGERRFASIPTLREGRAEPEALVTALATAHAAGASPAWEVLFEGSGAKAVALPTYPFQRERYWLAAGSGAGASGAGLGDPEHPLLGALVEDASGEGVTFSGRLSLQTQAWLADHALEGVALLPGAALAELALRAGSEVGCELLEELALQAPLVLPEHGAIQIQVSVGEPGEDGEREVTVHSRPEALGDEEVAAWTRHAQGALSAREAVAGDPLGAWPPAGAEPIPIDDVYDRLASTGLEYGPAFRGIDAAWRDGEEVYVEVSLPPDAPRGPGSFRVHPVLIDAALQATSLLPARESEPTGQARLPFAWTDTTLFVAGEVQRLRGRLAPRGEKIELELADEDGTPVARVGALSLRPIDRGQMRSAGSGTGPLLRVEWGEVAPTADAEAPFALDGENLESLRGAIEGGEPVPATVLAELSFAAGDDPPAAARAATLSALGLIREWLAAEELAASRLALQVEGGVDAGGEKAPDLAAASLWGLLRSAQAEHPGRFLLIDSDGSAASRAALGAAIASGEPQLALREGGILAPRLVRSGEGETAPGLDPDRTVLLTGGTGSLGGFLARHLAGPHGMRHLLLVSRRGEDAPGAPELVADLEAMGAEVRVEACDVGDRERLAALLASISPEHPLGAVVHTAGTVEDGLLESIGAEQIESVFGPKADAAWHLHELTADLDLSAFVLFSSIAGTLGAAGQANYAAANAFLDGLAARRRAAAMPAVSIAWGLWRDGMAAKLGAADLARLRRSGIAALTPADAVACFDAALATAEPLAVAAKFDRGALRSQASAGTLPAILTGLAPVPSQRAVAGGSLAERLAGAPEPERADLVLDLVRREAAAVLGHGSSEAIDPERPLKELGFDSLAAVELRNRLGTISGLRLATTVVFDYPTAGELSAHLLESASASGSARRGSAVRTAAPDEPIALVGMACRYPGDVEDPAGLWRLVAGERDCIGEFPADRGWDLARLFDPDPDHPRTSYASEGGFLQRADRFDTEFFGIAPREALAMDPQQRLLLEASWEALEAAGLPPGSLHGSAAGVFVGIMHHDYGAGGPPPEEIEGHRVTGGAGSVASGRVAYALGLQGPAMTVDTACSSSLVTLHLAAQALRAGECSLALAGGATVMATPGVFTGLSRQRGLAPDGRCKPFSDAANGVGWAEGVGMLVLERLSEAEANGHPVLATIRGSAVNQDGASNGLTAPNGPSQERVIRQALANARLEPKDVDAVEAHGTGTTLGDPIEAGALLATYGQDREAPLRLGSIKSNIGHTQAAAGVAGVIKMVMAMREGVLPKTLHVDAPSSKVDWTAGEIELLIEPAEWKPNGHPRRAGVSSFGISGTNAHVILEEGPGLGWDLGSGSFSKDDEAGEPLPGPIPLVLSAKTEEALRDSASRLATHLKDNPELDLTDLSFSLATTRAAMEERAAVVGEDRDQLLTALEALSSGEPSPDTHTATALSGRLAYLFTGQGSQRAGMGKGLYETYPAYAKALDEACEEIDKHLDRPLKDLLFSEPDSKEGALLDDTTYAQPALFATEVALYRMLGSFGLKPDLLTGHSVGEIVAAHVAGVLDLKDAAKLICARGRLMGALPFGGAMLAIEASEQEATESIAGKEELLSIAAINGPSAAVVSGDAKAIEALDAQWQEQGRKTKRLSVSHAFHSPLIEPMLEDFAKAIAQIAFQEPKLPIVSNTTGELLTAEQATDPAYWVSHVREPVRFADAVATLKDQGTTTYLELGPEAVLTAMATSCLAEEDKAQLIPTLREGRDEAKSLALAFASTVAAGAKPEWSTFFKGTGAKAIPLPTYPFQRKRYWLSSTAAASDPGANGQTPAGHPLLGASIEDPQGEGLTLTGRISLQTHPWLADHAVFDTAILPGTGFLELALEAAAKLGCEAVVELTLQAPLVIPEQGGVQLHVIAGGPDRNGERDIAVHSRPESEAEQAGAWTCHATGALGEAAGASAPEPIAVWPPEGAEPIELDSLYERLDGRGFGYGPAFRRVQAAWRLGEEVYAEVSAGDSVVEDAARFGIHPALLDASFHAVLDAAAGNGPESGELNLPFTWRGVRVRSRGAASMRVRVTIGEQRFSLDGFDSTGAPTVVVDSVITRALARGQLDTAATRALHGVEWKEVSAGQGASDEAPVKLLSPDQLEFERSGDPAAQARAATESALAFVQEWLAEEESGDERLILLTRGAVAVAAEEEPDVSIAPLCGLLRTAHSEHPGRFAMIDTDESEASRQALPEAISLALEEPQLALRSGGLLAPRLVVAQPETEGPAAAIDPGRTVLITGGTSGLGALVARHLVTDHGARYLLLVSRRGAEAPGAESLEVELRELGAERVTIAACDVSERDQLERLIDSVSADRPLGAVIHSAGALEDRMLVDLDAESLRRVMRPKADAAWHLHELTAEHGLTHFAMFSSAAGLLGGPSQANYAAANAFLDALAFKRRREGLAATSLAWGLWERESSLADGLSEAELADFKGRVRARLGFAPIPTGTGLELFDAALAREDSLLAPVEFDGAALRARAKAGALPPVLRGLVRVAPGSAADTTPLAAKLAGRSAAEREEIVLALVRSHVAAVLGHDSGESIPVGRAFKELGFDSLAAVELRNRLGSATGVRLPATIVFDHPSSAALAEFVGGQVEGDARVAVAPRPATATSGEAIAIVGMSCRFPGGVSSPAELWELVKAGGDAIGDFPGDRGWDLERLYDPDPDSAATSYARSGGFLEEPAHFDASFFEIGPREALAIDPQQRLLLEACWEAFEDAALDPDRLRGTQTGVFAGVMYHDYGVAAGIEGEVEGYMTSVSSGSVVSGRVAYALGLEGPTMSVDTACSSSLVAMHLACQALRAGECSLALAGGVTVLATPNTFIEFSRQRGLAADGRCKSFAESADGVGFAEGVGVLALERLSEAEANGHRVLATIRGSAVNQDGASNGLTAPNGPSQERVIRQALANARLEPRDIDAVEAHGTGTTLGDPIEAGALLATYGQDREAPLRLGSIKSNIGHAQAAAGVAGVIKTVMAMREGVLPKTLHVDAPSSKVDWEAGQIELLTEPIEWRPNGHPRRAGVSSFGASGTNAHLILEEGPGLGWDLGSGSFSKDDGESEPLTGPIPIVLSAKTEDALRDSASRLASHLKDNPELDLTDLSFSAATTRAAMEERAAVVGESREEILSALDALATGKPSPDTHTATALSGRLAYLFTGQGSQRAGMGKELYETYPTYREALDEACAEIDSHLDRPLKELLFGEPGSKEGALLDDTTYAQPALFATEVALFRLLGSFGLKPDLLTGHSVGEIVAAHVAGVLDLKDAAKLICARGRLMGALPSGGAMLAIEATEQEATESIAGKEELLSIAAINGPTATVVSGDAKAIEALDAQWQAKERKTKRLSVSHAFHSPLIEPMLEDFAKAIAQIAFQEPKFPIVSNTTGELLTAEQAIDPNYWVSHVREPVRFADAVATLKDQSTTTYLELGPEAVLTAMATSCLSEDDKAQLIPTLREGRDETKSLSLAFASTVTAGAKPEWSTFFEGTAAKAIPLPTYPFQRKRYWLSSTAASGDLGAAGLSEAEHPFLIARVEDPQGEGIVLTGRISLQTHPWLADHAVAGTVLLPGTAFVELALKAGQEVGCELVEELALQAPLLLPQSSGVAIQVKVGAPGEDAKREVSIHSRAETGQEDEPAEWACHAQGVLSAEQPDAAEPLGAWPPEGAEPIELDSVYERIAEVGFDYGPAFQGLSAAWELGEEVYAEISLAEEQVGEAGRFGVHPALFDAAFHAGLDLIPSDGARPVLPFLWRDVGVGGSASSSLRVRLRLEEGSSLSLSAFDASGGPLLTVGSVLGREVDPASLRGASASLPLYRMRWQGVEVTRDSAATGEVPVRLLELDELGFERSTDLAATARAAVQSVLEQLQGRLAEGEHEAERLALLTTHAVAASDWEDPDPAGAAVWGLVRSVQAEHPGAFALIDSDGTDASRQALADALAIGAGEPQLVLREGKPLVPRMDRLPLLDREGPALAIDPGSTVLITGATGALGALVARHLTEAHGAQNLLLVSRRGEGAEGAKDLRAQLEEFGASVRIEACDVAERTELEALIDSIDPEHPLGAIVHSAGVLDDGVVEALDAERVERVMRPKADAAWHLHELSEQLDLSAFVLFSSIGGALGGAGQANYTAANAFLDALAQHRKANGLPSISIGWGLWEGGMGAALGDADRARMQRAGLSPLSDAEGLELFDLTPAGDCAHVLPVRFDFAALRRQASSGALPSLLRGLLRAPAQSRRERGSLGERLGAMPADERPGFVLDLVRAHAATALGRSSATEVDPDRPFKELGFDSLAAVELRNGLGSATGMRLPATVVFDHPTATELAGYMLAQASGGGASRRSIAKAQASEEPIAIVGMSCRYPGGASSPRELWELVAEGRDAIGGLPTDRGWNLERLYDPNPDNVGTSYAREGGFLPDVADFDPAFFAMSPREALSTDPQQRLLLESSWEALEDAGIDPATLQGTTTGVFAGAMYQDYGAVEHGLAAGMSGSVVSGRVAYSLGLEGPAMTVDTACSSSLVTLHLASQALRQGECGLALAGGVTVLSTPWVLAYMSQQRGLSPDGRCKSFAETADGVGWSEGVGVLALERLSEAEANGHRVLATIRGSAVNQDGASNGLTAPNGPSQERVIRQALANARLEPKDVDAVEAHGTGTALGDPIEAGALLATYGQDREEPLKLGSIKSNIGHTQAAAGVAGVIKTVMAMREGVLPKTLHVDAPSSKVDWAAGRIELLTEPAEWKHNGHPRRAGVSSFGASGTNAHVILEEAPERAAASAPADEARPPLPGESLPVVLSAKSEPALRQAAARLASQLEANTALEPADVAYSLATTRPGFERRAALVAGDREELLAGLAALARGGDAPNLVEGTARGEHRPAFLFPGHGAQWRGMAVELADSSPLFAASMDACEEALEPLVDWSLREELRDESGAWMDRLDVLQPALFAAMVSLARLWQACGIQPAAVAGHSQGEISAAHIAGGLSLEDAARIVALRSKALSRIAGKGAMASVSIRQDELESLLAPFGERITLAAINGPASLVLSGDPESLEELIAGCEKGGVRAKRIAANGAGHSAQVEPLEAELLEAFAPISPRSGEIPFYSTVTGETIDTAELGPEYWYRNAREPVRFEPVIRSMLERGLRTLIEIGTHPVLGFVVQEAIDEAPRGGGEATAIGTLRRDEGGAARFALSLARAHTAGAEPDWSALFKGTGAEVVPLPTYPFQRRRYWLNPGGGASDPSAIGLSAAEHPFLGASIEDPRGEGLILTGRVSLQSHPWLADHAAADTALLPGTAFVEMALRAGREVGCELLEELAIQAPLVLSESGGASLQVRVEGPDERGGREVSIHSRAEAGEGEAWICHAEGVLSPESAEIEPLGPSWPPEGAEPIEVDSVYDRLAEVGFDYGPAFQRLGAAWKLGEEVYAEVSLAEEQASEAGGFAVHPALFDAAFHAGLDQRLADGGGLMLPFLWRGIHFAAAGASSLRVRLGVAGDSVSLDAFDSSGAPLLAAKSVVGREVDPASLRSAAGASPLYRLRWQEAAGALAGEDVPTRLLELEQLDFERSSDEAATARAATRSALEHVQGWLADEGHDAERLILLSEGAAAVSAAEDPDLSGAAVWGLVRSVSSEHPGRLAAIDSDGTEASRRALPEAVAISGEEPQIALREGRLLVPRLLAAGQSPEDEPARPIESASTVLITGGLTGIGAAVARHLADAHGARQLLLVSRSGEGAPAAAELRAELEGLGASVRIEACDVAERSQLEALIDSIDPEHPLGAIVHSAGVLDDGVVEALDAERVERVMRPKADAAWHLHELSEQLEISQFLLFSSGAGLLGGAAQANYSAANAFLDALAAHRRAGGLPATSLAWGLWEHDSAAMVNEVAADERERMIEQVRARLANVAMPAEHGLALFDAARSSGEPLAVAMRFDRAMLRVQASAGTLPALLRGLTRSSARAEDSRESLAERLAGMPESQHEGFVLDLVRAAAATVLGHSSAAEVEPDRSFSELGFDSLAAVELRNRLDALTGDRLSATVVFDYPTARDLTAYLLGDVAPPESMLAEPEPDPDEGAVLEEIDAMALDDLVERALARETADLEAGGAE